MAISGFHPQTQRPTRAMLRWVLDENFHGWRLHSISAPVSSWVLRCFLYFCGIFSVSVCVHCLLSFPLLSTPIEGALAGTDVFYHPAPGRLSQRGFYLMHMLEYPCGLVCVGTASCQLKQRAAEIQRSFS